MDKKELQALFESIGEEVSVLGDQAMTRLYPALIEAERELEQALKGMLEFRDETFTRAFVRKHLAQLKRVREKYKKVAFVMAVSLEQIYGAIRGISLSNLKAEILAQVDDFTGGITSQVNLFAANAAASQASSKVPSYDSSVARYPNQVWADINKQLQVSILKGDTVFDAVNRMLGTKSFVDAVARDGIGAQLVKGNPGLGRRYRYWAERLVRTETQSAYNHVHQHNISSLSKDIPEIDIFKRWDATLDYRLCKVCRGLHGKVFAPRGEIHLKTGGVVMYPPAHPNCRCCLVVFVPGLDDTKGSFPTTSAPAVAVPAPAVAAAKKQEKPKGVIKSEKPKAFKEFKAKDIPLTHADAKKFAGVKWGEGAFKKWYEALTEAQRDSLEAYVGVHYKRMNKALRGHEKSTDSTKKDIAQLTAALDKARMPRDVKTFRGAVVSVENLRVGSKIIDKGFRSTSLNEHVAKDFLAASDPRIGEHRVLYEIEVPKGSKAAYVMNSRESELLIQRDSVLEVMEMRYEKEAGYYVARVRLVETH